MLPRRTAMAPRGKLRGGRRYFRRVAREAVFGPVLPGADSWWNLWHHHADWKGWGNIRWRYRTEHIRALCTVYRSILDLSESFHTPFQAWIALDEADAGQDATFLHTPNPHTPFPIMFDVKWGPSRLEPLFRSLLPGLDLQLGTIGSGPNRLHIVWAAELGLPIDGRVVP